MLYDKVVETSELAVADWLSNEVFTYQWFIILGVLIIAYIVWLILLDKSRATKLLLLGSYGCCQSNYDNYYIRCFRSVFL